MTLAVLARFHTQSEAQVAASALRSAGLSAVVFDEHYGGMVWVEQSALGGYRLMLPATEMLDALAILKEAIEPPVDEDGIVRSHGSRLTTLGVLAGYLVAGPSAGWLIIGLSRRRSPNWSEAMGAVFGFLLVAGAVGVVPMVLMILYLVFGPPLILSVYLAFCPTLLLSALF